MSRERIGSAEEETDGRRVGIMWALSPCCGRKRRTAIRGCSTAHRLSHGYVFESHCYACMLRLLTVAAASSYLTALIRAIDS